MPLSTPASDPVRAAVRFPLRLDLTLTSDDREYHAVTEDVSHSLEARLLGCLPGVELHDADDSTHTG